MKSTSTLSLLGSFAVVALAVACTKTVTRVIPDDSVDGGPDASRVSTKPSKTAPVGDDDDDDTTSSSSSSSSSSSGSTSGAPTVNDCHQKANQQQCMTCCQQISPKGYQVYAQAQHDCGCQAQYCQDACKTTYCAQPPQPPPNPSTCLTCFNDHVQDCASAVNTDCSADADCKVFNDCMQTACKTLPPQ